jgi:hypothetical protein
VRVLMLQIANKIAEYSAPVVAKAKESVNIAYEMSLAGATFLMQL